MKILIVEDEPSLRELMERTLVGERYIVETAGDYKTAMQKIEDYEYDCILLDIMLPDGSGLDLLSHLKDCQKKDGVIIISAKDSIDDKVKGLEYGADDYLAKPFHLAELRARIKSILRRNKQDGDLSLQVGNVRLYPDKFQVVIGDSVVEFLRKEYDILHYFMARPNHVVDMTVFAEAIWGDHIDQVDSYDFVYAQIKNVRKKLKQAEADIEIKSVYGFGYKLVEL